MNISVFRKQNICWTNWKLKFDLLKEVLCIMLTVQCISEVLCLLSERVSVRTLKLIMEALHCSQREKMSLTLWSISVGNGVIFAM